MERKKAGLDAPSERHIDSTTKKTMTTTTHPSTPTIFHHHHHLPLHLRLSRSRARNYKKRIIIPSAERIQPLYTYKLPLPPLSVYHIRFGSKPRTKLPIFFMVFDNPQLLFRLVLLLARLFFHFNDRRISFFSFFGIIVFVSKYSLTF
jgi:hypothetical protein